MPAPPTLATLPRSALLALAGVLAGVVAALTVGELIWYVLSPEPTPVSPETQLDSPKPEPLAKPQAVPRLAVSVAAAVAVNPAGKNTFGVRVLRDQFDAPVVVRFDPSDGLSAAEITIPAGGGAGQMEVTAAPDAKPGTYTLTAAAVSTTDTHTLRARTPVAVTVLPPPAPSPRVGVSVSPKVSAYQRGKNTLAVRVARAEFDEPVAVTFDGLPDGVTVPAVTVPAGKTEATAELTVGAGAKLGQTKLTATAKVAPKGVAISAAAEATVEVLDANRSPLDVVLVLDCTGSMAKSADALRRNWSGFTDALAKARFDVRFGLVGFRDTTLNQPLELPTFGGEPLTADAERVAAALRDVRFGGGGGEGESSLDGLAKAADYPLRVGAARVLILVTDGPPKRVDRRVKSIDAAVEHLRARRIDQLHVVALPDHRKRFEPLDAGAKGAFFNLKDATDRDAFGRLTADLAKAITDAIPARPEPKPEPSAVAATAVLPEPKAVAVPAPPAPREPDEPQFAPPDSVPESPAASVDKRPSAKPVAAIAAWAAAVACVGCVLLFFGQMALPGERSTVAALATGYSGGLVVGLGAGALGFVALDAVGIGLVTRQGAAGLFGLLLGLTVAMAELLFRAPPVAALAALPAPIPPPLAKPQAATQVPQKPRTPILDLDLPPVEAYPRAPAKPLPPAKPPAPLLDLDLPPVEAYPSAPKVPPPLPPAVPPAHKPNIGGAAKPGDGCPGCGRKIPGAVGTRYCMVCDKTF